MTTITNKTRYSIVPLTQNAIPAQDYLEISGPQVPFESHKILFPRIGHDIATVEQNRPGIIKMKKKSRAGIYSGTRYPDLYLLTQLVRELAPPDAPVSELQGDEGSDWVIILDDPAVGAYTANLTAGIGGKNRGYFTGGNTYYQLKEIENLMGHMNSSEFFTGNEHANQLWGCLPSDFNKLPEYVTDLSPEQIKTLQGWQKKINKNNKNRWVAKDTLNGGGGDDVIAAATGLLTGEEGSDFYPVLPYGNAMPDDVFEVNNYAQLQETDILDLGDLDLAHDVKVQLSDNHFLIAPKDPERHQKIVIANFAKGASWQHLYIIDKLGNIYAPYVKQADEKPARLRQVNREKLLNDSKLSLGMLSYTLAIIDKRRSITAPISVTVDGNRQSPAGYNDRNITGLSQSTTPLSLPASPHRFDGSQQTWDEDTGDRDNILQRYTDNEVVMHSVLENSSSSPTSNNTVAISGQQNMDDDINMTLLVDRMSGWDNQTDTLALIVHDMHELIVAPFGLASPVLP